MKLRFKFIIIIACTIIIPILAGIFYTYYSINHSITKIETDKGKQNISHSEEFIDSLLESQKASMNSWLPWEDLYSALENKDSTWINNNAISSANENTPNEIIAVLDINLNIIAASDSVPKDWQKSNLKDLKIVKALSAENYFASDIDLADDGAYLVSIGKVCKTEDTKFEHPNGYFLTARKLTSDMIDKGKKIVDADITIKFENGYIISTIKNPHIVNSSNDLSDNGIKAYKSVGKNNMVVKAEAKYKDENKKAIGVIHVETISTSGNKALNELTKCSIVLVISIIILSGLMQLWLSIKVTKPINNISNIIKQKDLSQLVEINGKDEIASLGIEFNNFINTLMGNFKCLKEAINLVESLENSFIDGYSESNKSMEQISISISESTSVLNTNVNELKDITRTVNNANDNGKEILTILQSLKDDSKNINVSANNGIKSLEQMTNGIVETEEKFSITFKAFEQFTKAIKSIYEFTELIGEISAQSNLLALNASIEAARAGEAGRGFSIVSDEVRKLSIQTEEAVEKLNDIIADILKSTDQSTVSINDVKDQLSKAELISNSTYEVIHSILSNIVSITSSISNITEQSEQQEKSLENILQNIEHIEDSFDEVNSHFGQVTETTESHIENSENITNKVSEISHTIKELDDIVNQFKGI